MDNNTVWKSLPMQLLKLLATCVIAWFIVVMIGATFLPSGPDGAIAEKYDLPITLIALLLAFVVNMIIDFNGIQSLKHRIGKAQADIDSVNDTAGALIEKAERVADKYLQAETGMHSDFAEARKQKGLPKRIKGAADFKTVMESYPKLKANVHGYTVQKVHAFRNFSAPLSGKLVQCFRSKVHPYFGLINITLKSLSLSRIEPL